MYADVTRASSGLHAIVCASALISPGSHQSGRAYVTECPVTDSSNGFLPWRSDMYAQVAFEGPSSPSHDANQQTPNRAMTVLGKLVCE